MVVRATRAAFLQDSSRHFREASCLNINDTTGGEGGEGLLTSPQCRDGPFDSLVKT